MGQAWCMCAENTGADSDPISCSYCGLRTRVDHTFTCERCGGDLRMQLSNKQTDGTGQTSALEMQKPSDFHNLECKTTTVVFDPKEEAPWGVSCNFAEPLVTCWKVTRVDPNQQAHSKGVKRNWRLTKVNDVDVIQSNKNAVFDMLKGGGKCTIDFVYLKPMWTPARYMMAKRIKLQQTPDPNSSPLKEVVEEGEIVHILDATIVDNKLRGEVQDASSTSFDVRGWLTIYDLDSRECFVKNCTAKDIRKTTKKETKGETLEKGGRKTSPA